MKIYRTLPEKGDTRALCVCVCSFVLFQKTASRKMMILRKWSVSTSRPCSFASFQNFADYLHIKHGQWKLIDDRVMIGIYYRMAQLRALLPSRKGTNRLHPESVKCLSQLAPVSALELSNRPLLSVRRFSSSSYQPGQGLRPQQGASIGNFINFDFKKTLLRSLAWTRRSSKAFCSRFFQEWGHFLCIYYHQWRCGGPNECMSRRKGVFESIRTTADQTTRSSGQENLIIPCKLCMPSLSRLSMPFFRRKPLRLTPSLDFLYVPFDSEVGFLLVS